MPADPPGTFTGDVRLRNVAEGDLAIFFEQQCDSDALRMAAFVARDREAFMAHWANILADQTVLARTVLFDGQVAGNIGSWGRDGKRLVGYWIGKQFWGKGVATKALHEFAGMVQTRPLYAHVGKHNTASIRVLEKCGFTICIAATEALGVPSDGIEELVLKLGTSECGETHRWTYAAEQGVAPDSGGIR